MTVEQMRSIRWLYGGAGRKQNNAFWWFQKMGFKTTFKVGYVKHLPACNAGCVVKQAASKPRAHCQNCRPAGSHGYISEVLRNIPDSVCEEFLLKISFGIRFLLIIIISSSSHHHFIIIISSSSSSSSSHHHYHLLIILSSSHHLIISSSSLSLFLLPFSSPSLSRFSFFSIFQRTAAASETVPEQPLLGKVGFDCLTAKSSQKLHFLRFFLIGANSVRESGLSSVKKNCKFFFHWSNPSQGKRAGCKKLAFFCDLGVPEFILTTCLAHTYSAKVSKN